jgi:hypothetical protein
VRIVSKKNAIIGGGFVAAIVAVLLVTLLVKGETVTKVVAVAGCILALGKTGWDMIEKDLERQKKAEEGKEKIKATPKYGHYNSTAEELGVLIYNEGNAPVSIESVVCHWVRGGGTKEQDYPLFSRDGHLTEMVQPKHKLTFNLFNDGSIDINEMQSTPDDRLRISVRSHGGTEWRVKASEIAKAIASPERLPVG